jgi:asparagine synthase (glutamine-hydrolysing)
MCGLAGIIGFDGAKVDDIRLARAVGTLSHRGPDDRGSWIGKVADRLSVGLGHTRLAVIDPHPEGRQPMVDVSGRLVIVFNGEIYNYRALRLELEAAGLSMRTGTDTEVLVAGYSVWGEAVFQKMRGMWACCILDLQTGAGVLCRDPYGIKPLIYAKSGATLCFSSEMRALIQLLGSCPQLAPGRVVRYLRYGHVDGLGAMYMGCARLAPGHLLRFDAGGVEDPERYHHLQLDPGLESHDPVELMSALRDRIDTSVRERLVSDVPVGTFLSGGLDSSIVTYHAAQHCHGRLSTFSIGYGDDPAYDETCHARRVAAHLGTDHHELQLTASDVVNALPGLLDHLGEPFADSSLVPTTLVSAMCRRHVTVALSGDGADELFGGYHRYAAHAHWQRYARLPGFLRRSLIEPLLRLLPVARGTRLGGLVRQFRKMIRTTASSGLDRHGLWARVLDPAAEEQLLESPIPMDSTVAQRFADHVPAALRQRCSDDEMNQILLLDLHDQLPADMLNKVDLASMSASLEVRVPMLDPAVVALAVGLPSTIKVRGTRTKWLLREAYRGRLPDDILDRRKMGFELPIGEFLRGPLRDMFCDVVTEKRCQDLPHLRYKGVMDLYREHSERRADHADVLYAVLVLCWICGR